MYPSPLLRIVALYSNVLEDPGVIASPDIGTAQLDFLNAALTRAKGFAGALILAYHHPAYTVGSRHGWSEDMRADLICDRHSIIAMFKSEFPAHTAIFRIHNALR